MDSVIKKLDLSSVSSKITKRITNYAVVALALALAIPTGGASTWVGALYMKISDKFWRDKNMKKPRDKKTREDVSNQIPTVFADPETKKDLMKAFSEDIDKVAEDFDSFIDQTVTKAFDIVTLREFSL